MAIVIRILCRLSRSVDTQQVIFAGFTHEPAEKLARHRRVTPPELEYVFFSDSGSTSVEAALKMALGFGKQGIRRTRILALEVYGDTIRVCVAKRGVFNAVCSSAV